MRRDGNLEIAPLKPRGASATAQRAPTRLAKLAHAPNAAMRTC